MEDLCFMLSGKGRVSRPTAGTTVEGMFTGVTGLLGQARATVCYSVLQCAEVC
jgi:hypothetical protein